MPELHNAGLAPCQSPRDGWPPTPAAIDRQVRVLRERFALAPELARAVADIAFSIGEARS
ncbi:hypothetical protein [Bradyrhizobium sp. I1.7.5]|uniref:hypothetical protein n=1 Tax=Bradyrhizobium sp. I1.7.5 TaxID=3156363 RepID=UPI003390ACE7